MRSILPARTRRAPSTGAALALVSALWTLGAPDAARAQYVAYGPFEVYTPTVFREGPGFKIGDGLVLHPGLSTELGYDSNALWAGAAGGAGVLRLRPHLDIATLSPQRLGEGEGEGARPRLIFRFGAAVEYRQYLSTDFRIGTTQQFNASSDADLKIKPYDPLSFRLYNHFLVTNDARNLEVTPPFAPRIYDRIGALVTFRPRNGPLELGLGESFRIDSYLQSELAANRALSNDIDLYASLRVLPETTVKLAVRSSYVSFYDAAAVIPNSAPLRITAGAQSLILPWLGASLYVGYGNSLHFNVPAMSAVAPTLVGDLSRVSYNNFVGGAEARLLLIQRMRLLVGWSRDFFDSLFATYFVDDHLYVHYEHNLWRSLVARVNFDTYFRDYGALVSPSTLSYRAYRNGQTQRKDTLVGLSVEATYRPLAWLEAGVSYSLLDDLTDFGFVDGAGTRTDAAFVKHVVLFKVDLAY